MTRWWPQPRPTARHSQPADSALAAADEPGRAEPQAALAAQGGVPVGEGRGAQWHLQHGRAQRRLARHEAALASFEAALSFDPVLPDAHEARGNALVSLGRDAEALAAYDAVLAQQPARSDSRYNRGLVLLRLHRPDEALETFDSLLAAAPDDAEAHTGRGNALLDLRRLKAAASSYRQALQRRPDHREALHNLGVVLQELRSPDLAAEAFERLSQVAPGYQQVDGKLLHARMQACDWHDHAALFERVEAGLARGEAVADPFAYQGVSMRPELQKRCAELAARQHAQPPARQLSRGPRPRSERLRIGYVSGEFRQQATSVLAVELFERHDRSRFEVLAFDNGWDDGSALRRRVVAAFDEVVDIATLSDQAAAQAVHGRGIDILVDLNGYFGLARPGLYGWRPSPVQVNYLGFPGTCGAAWMDYIVADRRLIRPEDEQHYSERVVCLPGCYQPNDSLRSAPPCESGRAEAGLPELGFVYCCFNNNYKITPDVFAVWMSLLRQVPGSVLWLLGDNPAAERNLRASAAAQQVDPARLVFAPRVELPQHLARHTLADLFLDTLPCNAHTTASDALCAGLPVLSCTGSTFSGRVATSLLQALGLDALITPSLADYERQALRLAREPATLAALRARLRRSPGSAAQTLFSADPLRAHLEAAYTRMAERSRCGLAPEAFEL